jgi:hypothetical protein
MVRGLRLTTRPECAPGESRGPFLVLPMPVDALSPILTGVGDYVAEPEHDDGAIQRTWTAKPTRPARRATERIATITTSDTLC